MRLPAQAAEADEAEREEYHRRLRIRDLRERCFVNPIMRNWTFSNATIRSKRVEQAMRYVAKWEKVREANCGLLFWGSVGTGKSFLAGCIANALLEKEVTVCMTTNLTLDELKKPQDVDHQRIYDRVLAMTVPIRFTGDSLRSGQRSTKREIVKDIFEGGEADADGKNESLVLDFLAAQRTAEERVPIYRKMALTIREAAEYSNIGINKIDAMLKQPNCPPTSCMWGTKSW